MSGLKRGPPVPCTVTNELMMVIIRQPMRFDYHKGCSQPTAETRGHPHPALHDQRLIYSNTYFCAKVLRSVCLLFCLPTSKKIHSSEGGVVKGECTQHGTNIKKAHGARERLVVVVVDFVVEAFLRAYGECIHTCHSP